MSKAKRAASPTGAANRTAAKCADTTSTAVVVVVGTAHAAKADAIEQGTGAERRGASRAGSATTPRHTHLIVIKRGKPIRTTPQWRRYPRNWSTSAYAKGCGRRRCRGPLWRGRSLGSPERRRRRRGQAIAGRCRRTSRIGRWASRTWRSAAPQRRRGRRVPQRRAWRAKCLAHVVGEKVIRLEDRVQEAAGEGSRSRCRRRHGCSYGARRRHRRGQRRICSD